MSQLRARELYMQNQQLAQDGDKAKRTANALAMEKYQMQAQLDIANQRVANLQNGQNEITSRYKNLLTGSQKNPLPNDATQKFKELARKYPDFDFDPATGVSKFNADILFNSGSAELQHNADNILREFTQIMNSGEARRLNILVVGHTDDQAISKDSTRRHHPTNWHLSTDRANSVVLSLKKVGMEETRMGSAGYSMFQPVVPNSNDKNRSKNRRVEIFVLAPDAQVAGWDPSVPR
jgi:chemotaxis protein MotB